MKRFFKLIGCGVLAIIGVLLVLAFIGRDGSTAAAPTAASDPHFQSIVQTCQVANAMDRSIDVFDCIEKMKAGDADATAANKVKTPADCKWYQARLDDPLVDVAHKADYRRSMKKGCMAQGSK